MTEHQASEREKIELYLEHYDAINDIRETFDDQWEAFAEEWPDRLEASLERDGIDTADWTFLSMGRDWGSIFHRGWWRRTDDLAIISDRDRPDVRVSFIHRLEGNRRTALGDRTLFFYFRNAGSNDQSFIETFNSNFASGAEEIEDLLPAAAERTENRRNLTEAAYDIRVDDHDDFFDAYISALQRAFTEHAVENEGFVDIIDRIYEESIESEY